MSILDRAVVFACDFRPRVVNGLSVMPNHGRAGGAPAWLQLGDGSTASTFPTPLAGYGASFDGGDYVNTGVVDRYEYNSQFSLYAMLSATGAAGSTSDAGITSIDQNQNFRGIGLFPGTRQTSEPPRILLWNGFTTTKRTISSSLQANSMASASSFAVSYPGKTLGTMTYKDGAQSGSIVTTDTLVSETVKNGKSFLIGAWHIAMSKGRFFVGIGYSFAIIDGTITPADILELDTLTKAGIR